MSLFGAVANIWSAGKAAESAEDAARISAEASGDALAYQQEVEALPLAYRNAAMQGLGGEYGFTQDANGSVVSDGSTIEQRALSSPYYTGMLEQGEAAIGRNASATGRLRGGSTAADLGSNAQNAYMNAYNQQLEGLNAFTGTNLNTNAIANTMANIGGIQAQGITASSQATQQGYQNAIDGFTNGLNMFGGV